MFKSEILYGATSQSWSLGQNLRDRDETWAPRDRDLEQKVETRPRHERAETRHEIFEIRGSQKVVNQRWNRSGFSRPDR